MYRWYRRILAGLVLLFCGYNFAIYNQEGVSLGAAASDGAFLSAKAMRGADLWQDSNCVACHQLYGLGGYMGPDLTNVMSHPKKGPVYVKAFLNSGIRLMPKYHFTDEEQDALCQFLVEVDQTGYYPLRTHTRSFPGWVDLQYKTISSGSP